MIKLQFENVNTNKLHDELITAGINPNLVESKDNLTWITVEESEVTTVNNIVAIHDNTPIPTPKTELEILKETIDALVLASLEV
jgi:hypothetical protein